MEFGALAMLEFMARATFYEGFFIGSALMSSILLITSQDL